MLTVGQSENIILWVEGSLQGYVRSPKGNINFGKGQNILLYKKGKKGKEEQSTF